MDITFGHIKCTKKKFGTRKVTPTQLLHAMNVNFKKEDHPNAVRTLTTVVSLKFTIVKLFRMNIFIQIFSAETVKAGIYYFAAYDQDAKIP